MDEQEQDQTAPAEVPVSDEHGTPYARAYDENGNVRPADGRWLGDANGDVPAAELADLREQELEDARVRSEAAFRKQEEETQARLEAAGYVNPTTPEARARDAAGTSAVHRQAPSATPAPSTPQNGTEGGDAIDARYADMEYADMQAEASGIDGIAGNLPKEELRAALIRHARETA